MVADTWTRQYYAEEDAEDKQGKAKRGRVERRDASHQDNTSAVRGPTEETTSLFLRINIRSTSAALCCC